MDTTTALTLVFPEIHWPAINAIRQEHDRAYPRWMPHINLLFPFIPQGGFDIAATKLEKALSGIGPITVNFDTVDSFAQRKQATYHLKPSDPGQLPDLFAAVREALPEIEVKRASFAPHLTLGQCKKSESAARVEELQRWLCDTYGPSGLSVTFGEVSIISRSKSDPAVPFTVVRTIALK